MLNKLIKIFLCFSISFTFAQDNTSNLKLSSLDVKIAGMHCAGGCAKFVENSLNNNDGISAVVDFPKGSASIEYDPNLFSTKDILNMINGYQGGKFRASKLKTKSIQCSKGKACCQKTGVANAACDNKQNGCCAGSGKECKKTKKGKRKKS